MGRDLLQPHVCSTTSSLAGFCLLAPRVGAGGGGGGSEHAAVSPPPLRQGTGFLLRQSNFPPPKVR